MNLATVEWNLLYNTEWHGIRMKESKLIKCQHGPMSVNIKPDFNSKTPVLQHTHKKELLNIHLITV